jgi:hypothetical protein
MCELYTQAKQPVFSYRFDTILYGKTALQGVEHFDNTAFSFQNISGLLGPSPQYDADLRLARAIGESYVRFIYNLDPNPAQGGVGGDGSSINALTLPYWPNYNIGNPVNMVLNASGPYVEPDTFRKEGIEFLNTFDVARELLA